MRSLFDDNLNVQELDGRRCVHCKKVPKTIVYYKINKKGEERRYVDRSSRIDCDAGDRKRSILVTYHKECWAKETGFNK